MLVVQTNFFHLIKITREENTSLETVHLIANISSHICVPLTCRVATAMIFKFICDFYVNDFD